MKFVVIRNNNVWLFKSVYTSTTILGISALYHDSAAAVICDEEIIVAAQEERFTRKKADTYIPVHVIDYCLKAVNEQIDQVVYYDNSILTMDRWLSNCTWLKGRLSENFKIKI